MSAPLAQSGEGDFEPEECPNLVPVKTYKLYIHTIAFCTEDLVIRSEDFPDVLPGDILEIYHEEESFSRLLLQVGSYSSYAPIGLS